MTRGTKPKQVQRHAALTFVALLRGINVGGKHVLPMSELAAMFTEAGCTAVRPYIQSGNVVFSAPASIARGVPKRVTDMIAERRGFDAPVIVRTAAELERVVRDNPFLKLGFDPDPLYVVFLADLPEARRVAELDPNRSPGDSFKVRGREIYLHLPNGVARSKLTNAYFDSKLATTSTGRNWRTVLKLVELTRVIIGAS